MKRLVVLGVLAQLAGCDMVVGIDDVVLGAGGAGGAGAADAASAATTSAATSSTADVSGSSATGQSGSLCESMGGDAFDALVSSRWSVDAGQAEARSGQLALRMDATTAAAVLSSRAPMTGDTPCAAWVTVADKVRGIEQGLGVVLDDGTIVALFRNEAVVANDRGATTAVADKDVVMRLRFASSPPRLVYEVRAAGAAQFTEVDTVETTARPAAPIRLYARKVAATGSTTVHFDDFDR